MTSSLLSKDFIFFYVILVLTWLVVPYKLIIIKKEIKKVMRWGPCQFYYIFIYYYYYIVCIYHILCIRKKNGCKKSFYNKKTFARKYETCLEMIWSTYVNPSTILTLTAACCGEARAIDVRTYIGPLTNIRPTWSLQTKCYLK